MGSEGQFNTNNVILSLGTIQFPVPITFLEKGPAFFINFPTYNTCTFI